LLFPRRTKSESNITTFEGRRRTFLWFQLSKNVQSNVAPAPELNATQYGNSKARRLKKFIGENKKLKWGKTFTLPLLLDVSFMSLSSLFVVLSFFKSSDVSESDSSVCRFVYVTESLFVHLSVSLILLRFFEVYNY
jgi:hypothetical protein